MTSREESAKTLFWLLKLKTSYMSLVIFEFFFLFDDKR